MRAFASTTRTSDRKPADLFSLARIGKYTPAHSAAASSVFSIPRKASCACGGGCPNCQAKSSDLKVSQPNDPAEIEADRIADKVMRMPIGQPASVKSDAPVSAGIHRKSWQPGEEGPMLRKADKSTGGPVNSGRPSHVSSAISSGGQSLDSQTRAFFEPRLGHDLSEIRIHTGVSAENSAEAVNARAYTIGSDIVFARNEYQPANEGGKRLLAHEIAHVVQQRSGRVDKLHRTPAKQVSCASHTPLVIPGTGVSIADPVGVITAAEDRANQMFDDVIAELEYNRRQILGGAPAAFPTISDAIAQGLRIMGLNPENKAIWTAPKGTGLASVPLLLRRLKGIRSTIGAGSFFFFCLGTGKKTLGGCAAKEGEDICTGAVASTCAGQFFTTFCPPFWSNSAERQAGTIVHESAHNFATFIEHSGRFSNAPCFARLVQVYAGVSRADQRPDQCPDP
jgi:hypothetical protein